MLSDGHGGTSPDKGDLPVRRDQEPVEPQMIRKSGFRRRRNEGTVLQHVSHRHLAFQAEIDGPVRHHRLEIGRPRRMDLKSPVGFFPIRHADVQLIVQMRRLVRLEQVRLIGAHFFRQFVHFLRIPDPHFFSCQEAVPDDREADHVSRAPQRFPFLFLQRGKVFLRRSGVVAAIPAGLRTVFGDQTLVVFRQLDRILQAVDQIEAQRHQQDADDAGQDDRHERFEIHQFLYSQ